MKPRIFDLSAAELQARLGELGLPRFTTVQVMQWLYLRLEFDPANWSNISLENRARIAAEFDCAPDLALTVHRDPEGTAKYLFGLHDGRRIEAVAMKEKGHYTLCISSQVGCALGCRFCATGGIGFQRNLSCAEILSQVARLRRDLGEYRGQLNLVFMGMGEPLLNYDNLKKALELIIHPNGMAISPRRITVSTAGIRAGLERLERDFPLLKIAVSLNATRAEQRAELMPVERAEPIAELLQELRQRRRRHRITFEYVLLRGINDSPQDADRLVGMLHGIPAKLNLIPYNENPGLPYQAPAATEVDAFAERLAARQITVVVRWSKGRNQRAACGQLAAAVPDDGATCPPSC